MAVYSSFDMRAWNTNLTLYVYWTVEGSPDFVGTYSGYTPADLTNFSVVRKVDSLVLSYSNTTRPDPSTVTVGVRIWNTDDRAPQWSDGIYWRDSDGNIT